LKDQRELFAGLDDLNDEPPLELLRIKQRPMHTKKRSQERGEGE
jgi:hypothetical protein